MVWYVYKIIMIRVFFSAGRSARIACIRLSSPSLIFRTASFSWAQRLLDSQITSGNKQNLRPRRASGASSFHDKVGRAVDILEGAEAVFESVRNAPEKVRDAVGSQFSSILQGTNFLTFQRTAISVCFAASCTRIRMGSFFLRFVWDQISSIFESN